MSVLGSGYLGICIILVYLVYGLTNRLNANVLEYLCVENCTIHPREHKCTAPRAQLSVATVNLQTGGPHVRYCVGLLQELRSSSSIALESFEALRLFVVQLYR
jgi:hypothetical protein